MSSFKILPVLMVVAAICFGVRFSDMIKNIAAAGSIEAYAAEAGKMEPSTGNAPPSEMALKGGNDDAKQEDVKDADNKNMKAAMPEKPEVNAPTLGDAPKAKGNWKGADDLDDEYSDVRMELFEDLSKRRKDLDAKEKELTMREALIKAAQSELEQKTKELTTIKTDIEALLKQQTEQEDKRIASLVKIYEGMKAKDAARIFDSLEMDVLLQVMTKMSERKSAPILAAMDAERARTVTIKLAEQNKLPSLPQLPVTQ